MVYCGRGKGINFLYINTLIHFFDQTTIFSFFLRNNPKFRRNQQHNQTKRQTFQRLPESEYEETKVDPWTQPHFRTNSCRASTDPCCNDLTSTKESATIFSWPKLSSFFDILYPLNHVFVVCVRVIGPNIQSNVAWTRPARGRNLTCVRDIVGLHTGVPTNTCTQLLCCLVVAVGEMLQPAALGHVQHNMWS